MGGKLTIVRERKNDLSHRKETEARKEIQTKKLSNSLFDIMLTLGRTLLLWISIFIPIALSISILFQNM